jgi:uncharacterized protein YbjQ (UPF0145 family)
MPTCDTCGRSFGILNGSNGRCRSCHSRNLNPENFAQHQGENSKGRQPTQDYEAARTEADKRRDAIILTTETVATGLTVEARLGIVTAECVFGMHLFKDLFAIGRDIAGGRSETIQNTLKDARNTALKELKAEALALGANAVIAVDLDYSEISGGGKSMLFLVASGTAVILSKDQS